MLVRSPKPNEDVEKNPICGKFYSVLAVCNDMGPNVGDKFEEHMMKHDLNTSKVTRITFEKTTLPVL